MLDLQAAMQACDGRGRFVFPRFAAAFNAHTNQSDCWASVLRSMCGVP